MKAYLLGLLIMAAPIWGQGTLNRTVFPYGLENSNGNIHDNVLRVPDERQQWFSREYLAQAWNSPVRITEVAFRVNDETGGVQNYNETIPHVIIAFGTTPLNGGELAVRDNAWERNTAGTAQIVYDHTSVTLSSQGGIGPNPFGLRFTLDTPFLYDPSAGNLMMLIRTEGTQEFIGGTPIDAHGVNEGIMLIDSARFDSPIPRALVGEITWLSIPEPGVSSLLLLALGVSFVVRRIELK